jgi:hypothetical protein
MDRRGDLRYVLQSIQLLLNLLGEAPAFVNQKFMLRAETGQLRKDMDALDSARIDHSDELLVPIVIERGHFVIFFGKVCPRVMYVEVCCQPSVLECVSFERVGYAPNSIELFKELVFVW